jgi:hypothetical protein
MFSKKARKIDKIFTVDLTLCSKCQINGEDLIIFCGFLRKHELYHFLFSRYFPSNGELVHIFVTDMKMPEELEKLDQVVRDLQNQVSNMISLIELDSTLSES